MPAKPENASPLHRPYGIAPAGAALPEALRLGGVQLQVSDLDRSLDFYQKVLGLVLASREGGHAVLTAHGSAAPLVELFARAGTNPLQSRARLGLFHFAILVPDRAALGRFVAHLAAIGVRPGASDHLVSEALYLNDPDGLGIEVYADRPRTHWQHRDRQLAMATEPLDLPDLVRAAAGVPWNGMPEGTTMGHLHLHVGDIAQAEAFYHAALGFEKMVWSYPGALFLAAGGYHHHLGLNTWAAWAPPAGETDARLLAWEIQLPSAADVEAALARLRVLGAAIEGEGESERQSTRATERTRDRTTALVRDPWGTPFRVRVRE